MTSRTRCLKMKRRSGDDRPLGVNLVQHWFKVPLLLVTEIIQPSTWYPTCYWDLIGSLHQELAVSSPQLYLQFSNALEAQFYRLAEDERYSYHQLLLIV